MHQTNSGRALHRTECDDMNSRFTDPTQDRCKGMLEHIQRDINSGQPKIDNVIQVPGTTGNGMADTQHEHTPRKIPGELGRCACINGYHTTQDHLRTQT